MLLAALLSTPALTPAVLSSPTPILFSCRVMGSGRKPVPFALLNDHGFARTIDPARLLPINSTGAQLESRRLGYLSVELPQYAGPLPHGGIFVAPGEIGGKAEFAFASRSARRARLLITHWRAPPAGQTIVYNGTCSILTGSVAVRRFEARPD